MKYTPLFSLLFSVLVLTGCVTTSGKQHSGFLTSYSHFRDGPRGGVDKIWTDPKVRTQRDFSILIAKYDSVMIDPIRLYYADKDAYDGVAPEKLAKLTQLLRQTVEKSLMSRYRIVSEPSPSTMRISLALTGVETPNPILATTSSVMPFGLGLSMLSKVTTGEHTNVGSATIEAAFTDSATGQALFAVLDRKAGEKDLATIHDPLDDAKDAFRWWGERLHKTLVAR